MNVFCLFLQVFPVITHHILDLFSEWLHVLVSIVLILIQNVINCHKIVLDLLQAILDVGSVVYRLNFLFELLENLLCSPLFHQVY